MIEHTSATFPLLGEATRNQRWIMDGLYEHFSIGVLGRFLIFDIEALGFAAWKRDMD